MRTASILIAAATLLSACSAVSAVGTAASVAGSIISTTAEVTGDVIGGATRTVSGSSDNSDTKSK